MIAPTATGSPGRRTAPAGGSRPLGARRPVRRAPVHGRRGSAGIAALLLCAALAIIIATVIGRERRSDPSAASASAALPRPHPHRHPPVTAGATLPAEPDSSHRSLTDALADRLSDSTGLEPLTPELWERVRMLYSAPGASEPTAFWLSGVRPTDRTGALREALASAFEHGVRLSPLLLSIVEATTAELTRLRTPDALARAELLLTAAFAEHGRTLLAGQVSPRGIGAAWHIDPLRVDVDSALARALRAADFRAALGRLAPQEDGYATLRRALDRYRVIAASGGWAALRLDRTLRPGDTIPPNVHLARRLAAEGFLGGAAAGAAVAHGSNPMRYAGAIVEAVARFQARHGLAVDSIIGPRTIAALDVPAGERLRQIAANLERYRWLPSHLGSRYIVVNVPAFRLHAFDGDRRALSMRVVVGAELEGRRTPIFSDSMSYVQFGPYWNVPPGIAHEEILPLAVRDRDYLRRNDFELVRGWGARARIVDPWALTDAELLSGRYRVRQRPGALNALGRVKFMFPNDYHVYLHDTPERALFGERVRAFSHGCVRVADPAALAVFVLAGRPEWQPARIREVLARRERVRVDLREKIPVYLIYLTAFEQDGALAFRADRYTQDERLMRALGDPPTAAHGAATLVALGRALDAHGAPSPRAAARHHLATLSLDDRHE